MTKNWMVGTALAVAAAIAYLVLGWPVQRAVNAYGVAETTGDRAASCLAASEAASAYAQLGWVERNQEWKDRGALDCAMAQLESQR